MATVTQTIWDTGLGKELAKVIPPHTRRVIIDLPYDDIIRVYYECGADDAILELNWENALSGAEVISATQKAKDKNEKKGVWLGLTHISQEEYESRLAKARKNSTCWVCSRKLKKDEECIHRYA